ncbi:MAG TPA: PA14 domain-containing protein [Abditibacterium sp.]
MFRFLWLLLVMLVGIGTRAALAQTVVMNDDFSSPTLNSSLWNVADDGWVIHRTRFGNQPRFASDADGTKYMRMPLNTFTASDANYDPNEYDAFTRYFSGTDINSKSYFKMGPGLEFETRIRGTKVPRGTVMAFFTYKAQGYWPRSLRADEIDYEMLGNLPANQLWCHIWDDWNPSYGYDGGVHDLTTLPVARGWDRNKWSTYKIRWLNNRVECFVNNVLVRTETKILPDDPMRVELNFWVPDSSWKLAYDAALQTTSQSDDTAYFMDVDYVRVRTVAPPARAVIGSGDGLAASYHDQTDFSGPSIERVDPRVNFNWSGYFPESELQQDTFSVRWKGQVQAQYSQAYTFITRTDDGVRLWVNNKLVIDKWQPAASQAPTESKATVNLVAGTKYNLKMEYFQNTGNAVAQLLWSSSSTPRQLVPQCQLYPTYAGDSVAPSVEITVPGDGFSYATLSEISGTASDAGGSELRSVKWLLFRNSDATYWNGSAWTTAIAENAAVGTSSWKFTPPPLSEGGYQVQAVARDGDGNIKFTPWRPFYIDQTAPTLSVSTPTANSSYPALNQAVGTASDAIGVRQIQGALYRYSDDTYWNGNAWQSGYRTFSAQGTSSWTANLPPLSDGKYAFEAVAQDFVGNTRYSGWIPFDIKSSAPAS